MFKRSSVSIVRTAARRYGVEVLAKYIAHRLQQQWNRVQVQKHLEPPEVRAPRVRAARLAFKQRVYREIGWVQTDRIARQLRAGAWPVEQMLYGALKKARVPQRWIAQSPFPGIPAIVDLYFPDQRLVVEVDGPSHKGREDKDRRRDRALETRNLKVLRVTNDEVLDDVEKVVRKIQRYLVARKYALQALEAKQCQRVL